MIRIRVFVALLVAALLVPAAAAAHRRATGAERRAIIAAVIRQRELSKAQAVCQVVTVSTANASYASLTWPVKLSKACMQVAANGVIIEHRNGRQWDFVTVGSSFRCPLKGVPDRVATDLGVCTPPTGL